MALKGKKCCLRYIYQLLQIEMLSDGSLFTKYVTRIIDYSFKILLDFLKVINIIINNTNLLNIVFQISS